MEKAKQLAALLRDTAQSASNSIASNISAPVDLLAMGMRGIGLPVPQNAFGGSQWMAEKGLTRDVPMGAPQIIGEVLGMAGPMVAAAKAPQIARGLLQGADNLAVPRAMNNQAGMITTQFGRIPENGRDTNKLADMLERQGLKKAYSVTREGSAVSPSQYVTFSKPTESGVDKTLQVRLSNHADKYPELANGVRTSVDPATETTFEQAVNWLAREGFPTDISKKYQSIPTYEEYYARQELLRNMPEQKLRSLQAAWLNKPKATRGEYPKIEDVLNSMAIKK